MTRTGFNRLEPTPPELDPQDKRTVLRERLCTVLAGLPAYFEFNNHISGVNATDLYSLNTLLGASIEGQVVKTLNQQRSLWDPDNDWLGYTFERQSQAFPDVRLVKKVNSGRVDIALGVELKGWFLLSKEGEPSFRFTQTPAACSDYDLLAVVPWYLDNVLSGSPVAAQPLVLSAKWAAEYRNYYWQYLRDTRKLGDRTIHHPSGARPYPTKDQNIADTPADDKGGNFGRLARVPVLMTDWIAKTNELEVLGIRIRDWYRFLKLHSDHADLDRVSDSLENQLARKLDIASDDKVRRILAAIVSLTEECRTL